MNKIVQHVERSKCRPTYTDKQLSSLREHSQKISAAKKKIKDAERYARQKAERARKKAENYNPTERAEKYSANKTEISRKNAENYNPAERAEKYSANKTEISRKNAEKYNQIKRHERYMKGRVHTSLNYYKRRNIREKRYDKNLRRKKYKKVMGKIAKQRKELKEDKQSKAGRIFSEVCDKMFLDVYNKIESDNLDFALGMQEKYRENNEIDALYDVFEKELWINNFHMQTYDC
jgi:hypothetical protein